MLAGPCTAGTRGIAPYTGWNGSGPAVVMRCGAAGYAGEP